MEMRGGEKRMKKKIAGIVFVLIASVMATTVVPVMAFGPWQAFEVDNNPNLDEGIRSLINQRGAAAGNVAWFMMADVYQKWSYFDAVAGLGKANSAVEADISVVATFLADLFAFGAGESTVNENKWFYLSPEGSGNQYTHSAYGGPHGMVYWLTFYASAGLGMSTANRKIAAAAEAALHPDGVYWRYNFIAYIPD
jgi:hypothetical protein